MKFDIHAGQSPNINKYFSKDIEIAREFAKKMYHEFGNFLQGIILFGSTISNPKSAKKDTSAAVRKTQENPNSAAIKPAINGPINQPVL